MKGDLVGLFLRFGELSAPVKTDLIGALKPSAIPLPLLATSPPPVFFVPPVPSGPLPSPLMMALPEPPNPHPVFNALYKICKRFCSNANDHARWW